MDNSRTCDICNVNVHRASFAKHLRSKKHLENVEKTEMIIPEWLFKEEKSPVKKRYKKHITQKHYYNSQEKKLN